MAMASASCASGESAPKLIAALSKRFTIEATDSTSDNGSGVAAGFTRSKSRSAAAGRKFT